MAQLRFRALQPPFTPEERRGMRFGLVPAECQDLLPVDVPRTPIVPEPLGRSAHLMPVLLDTHSWPRNRVDAFQVALDEAGEKGAPCAVPLWIDSDQDAVAMTRRWQSAQVWRHGDQVAWLRAFDPRVLLHLPRVFGPRHWRHWHIGWRRLTMNVGGQWGAVDLDQGPIKAAHDPGPSPRQAEVTQALDRIEVINRALALLGRHDAATLLEVSGRLDDAAREAAIHLPDLDVPQLAAHVASLERRHEATAKGLTRLEPSP